MISNTKPAISIIVPVYNVEAYLPRCVDSILNQTFSDFELILVDDGSPDHCGAICDEYAGRDPRIHVIHQENAKISAARNAGIDLAAGEWITFVDSDDWIHKDFLKVLINGTKADTDIVICKCLITSGEQAADVGFSDVAFRDASINDVYADRIASTRSWGRLIRRSRIGSLRYIPGTEPTEDSAFNELFFSNDMRFRITDAKLYYYFMRPNSAINTMMGRSTLNAIRPLLKELQSIRDSNKRRRIISRCYKYIFSARYGEMFSDDYADVQKQCRDSLKQLSEYRSELSKKDQMIMGAFAKSPWLYRRWRIHDDPTLLQFEKNQKRLGREHRINKADK